MADSVWTIERMLSWCSQYLEQKNIERPRLAAEWLLSAVCDLSRVELYTNFDRELTKAELDLMRGYVQRRAAGEPLQYVTGEMPFRHLVIDCAKEVLIPRPETETLVDIALSGVDAAQAAGHSPVVLELGVGTGCISLSIASERPQAKVVGTDISAAAIALATQNREKYALADAVELICCNLADGVPESYKGAFDVLVSNPPYIPEAVLGEIPTEVSAFEPHLALTSGKDGLDLSRQILALAPQYLRKGGLLCLELFEKNVDIAAEICRGMGVWESVEVQEDLNHRPRFLVAKLKGSLAEGGALVQVKNPKIKSVDMVKPSRAIVDLMADSLLEASVVVMPTDSVYGIGCLAAPHNPAHKRIFEIKKRDIKQTLPWLIADSKDLLYFGAEVPSWALALAEEFWPGALTLVVKASDIVADEYILPASAEGERGSIALRVPDCELVRQVIRKCGLPLATTSANTHGQPSATSGSVVEDRLIEMSDLILDAGPAPIAVASTIVDCTGTSPKILRQGAIPASEISRVAGLLA